MFPNLHKPAVVFPQLKKPSLDADDLNSYRTSVLFRNLWKESLLADLSIMLKKTNCFRSTSLRRHYSTESSVVKVMNDIIRSIDDGKVVPLVLIDLTAAFDTVDHEILLEVLQNRFSINDIPLSWFHSYLTDRTLSIIINGLQSVCSAVVCSVSQGSVLGAIEFICYTEDVVAVFNRNSVDHHLYADDKQLYSATTVTDIATTRERQLYSRRS